MREFKRFKIKEIKRGREREKEKEKEKEEEEKRERERNFIKRRKAVECDGANRLPTAL